MTTPRTARAGGPGAANHACPGCGRATPHHMLSCRPCWMRLPPHYRTLINATYRARNLFPRDHRQAVQDAVRWYRENPIGRAGTS